MSFNMNFRLIGSHLSKEKFLWVKHNVATKLSNFIQSSGNMYVWHMECFLNEKRKKTKNKSLNMPSNHLIHCVAVCSVPQFMVEFITVAQIAEELARASRRSAMKWHSWSDDGILGRWTILCLHFEPFEERRARRERLSVLNSRCVNNSLGINRGSFEIIIK